MPAKRFFHILSSSREIENEKRWNFIVELCDVANIANCTQDYKEKIQNYYLSRILKKNKPAGEQRSFKDARDPTPANVLTAVFATKAKVEGLTSKKVR